MIRLVINGDDFGMNERCSIAIAQAFSKGIITDTTMMANGASFDEAVALAKDQGFSHRIGIHLNLTEGTPLTENIKSIADFVIDGHFHKGYIRSPRSLDKSEQDMIYAELSAQVEKLSKAGIHITHADSHHYIHNRRFLAPIVARLCREYEISRVRLQRNLGDASGYEMNNRFWQEQGFITTDYFGRSTDFADNRIPDKTEIMVHPDFDVKGNLIDRRKMDGGYPVGEPLRDFKTLNGVILYSYRDLS